jgi:N-acetylglucosamine-6-sulfatase
MTACRLRGFIVAVAIWMTCGHAVADAKRPNVILVLTDDQRHDAMGCAGHPFLKTPHMDRLAREGVRFTRAFVTTSLCSPSRASFLTGAHAHKHGVWNNRGGDPDSALAQWPALLKKAGYETAYIGKWHMAKHDRPRAGFDRWVSFRGQGRYSGNRLNVDGKAVATTEYVTDVLTDHAVEFLSKERDRPFAMILSHKAVHGPFTPAQRHARLFEDETIKLELHPGEKLDEKPQWGRKRPKDWEALIRGYLRSLVAVDESVGRVLEELDRQKITDDTIVIFTSDNGYFFGEHGGLWDKRAAYEPSIRIPLLMRYSRKVPPGTTNDDLVLNLDVAPTLLELCGVDIPQTVQGRSWMGALRGERGRDSFLYEYFRERDVRFDRPSVIALRTREWKLITYPERTNGVTVELYDMRSDVDELHNLALAPAHQATVKRLRAELEKRKVETGFRFPPR